MCSGIALSVVGAARGSSHIPWQFTLTILYTDIVGVAFPILSLFTNVIATVLIAIKAWYVPGWLLLVISPTSAHVPFFLVEAA